MYIYEEQGGAAAKPPHRPARKPPVESKLQYDYVVVGKDRTPMAPTGYEIMLKNPLKVHFAGRPGR
jgi:hypothetical protein